MTGAGRFPLKRRANRFRLASTASMSASPVFDRSHGTIRRLKAVIVALLVSNIALGALSFYLLRDTDRRYSELIENNMPLLNDLQTLTARSVVAMRVTGSGLLEAASGEPRNQAARYARSARDDEAALRTKLLARPWTNITTTSKAEFQRASETFATGVDRVITLALDNKISEATQLRETTLRPAFEKYQSTITRLADAVELGSRRASNALSEKTGSASTLVLGLAGWPILITLGLIAITAIFVLALMLLFRGSDAQDAP
jgi:hypothetical protein